MNKNKVLKIVLVAIMGVMLIAMSVNVFAATGITDDNFLDINVTNNTTNTGTSNTNTGTNTNTNTNININTNLNTNMNTSNTNNYNTSLPEAGLEDNPMLVVSITVLGIISVFAYKKIREYKNI